MAELPQKIFKKILGIDVGKEKWGWCFLADTTEESNQCPTVSYQSFYKRLAAIMALYKPDIVVVGKVNMYYQLICSHYSYIGVVRLLCEKAGIPEIEINDMTARATLFPGEGRRKELMKRHFPSGYGEDQIDATILAKAWKQLQQGKTQM
jgi:hypothetical protein